MKSRRATALAFMGGLTVLVVSDLREDAEADGIPRDPGMFYSGTLEEDGALVTGTRDFSVRFWSAPTGGAQLCGEVARPGETVSNGAFRFPISEECLDAVHATPNVFVALQVGTEAPLPRVQLGAVPYAVEAERASEPSGSLQASLASLTNAVAELQQRRALSASFSLGPPAVEAESESWVTSVANPTVGRVEVSVAGGVFSAVPRCVCTATTSDRNCVVAEPTATSFTLLLDDGGAASNVGASVICQQGSP